MAAEGEGLRKELIAERVGLRPITKDDAAFYLTLMTSPKWAKYIGDRGIYTEEACRAYIKERMISQWDSMGMGNFIVYRLSDRVPLGCVGIFSRPGLDTVDLGFAFAAEHEKQGYAFESASRLLSECFTGKHLTRLKAITKPDNHDSQQLLRRLGFVSKGTVVLEVLGKTVEDDLFELTEEEYFALQPR